MQYPPNPPDPYQSPQSSPSYPSYPPAQQPPPPPGGYQPSTDPYAPPPPSTGPYSQTQPSSGSYPYTYPPQQMPPQYGGPYQPMPQPPRKGRGLIWVIVSVVAVLIIIGAAVAAVAANSNKQNQQASATPTAQTGQATQPAQTQPTAAPTQPSSNTGGTHKVGDVVTLDGWQVVVNNVKTSAGDEFNQPKPGDTFLLIDITATNQTGQSQAFSSLFNFTLKDSTGQKYDETIDTNAPSSPDGNVANGGKIRGTLAYDVPKTQNTFELDFTPDITSNDVATWSLTV